MLDMSNLKQKFRVYGCDLKGLLWYGSEKRAWEDVIPLLKKEGNVQMAEERHPDMSVWQAMQDAFCGKTPPIMVWTINRKLAKSPTGLVLIRNRQVIAQFTSHHLDEVYEKTFDATKADFEKVMDDILIFSRKIEI